ncbi:MAG: MAPEG family protein [Gammaproteobacteria bacterium]
MEHVALVILLIIVEYMVFSILVGKARGTYDCPAPAVSGHPVFERYYRVHVNTLEQMIIIIPAMLIFGVYGSPLVAAGVGVLFIIGRVMYLLAYVKDPAKRGAGFIIGYIPTALMVIAGIVALVMDIVG